MKRPRGISPSRTPRATTLCIVVLTVALAITAAAQRSQNNSEAEQKARNAPDVFVYSASAFGPDKNGDSHFTIEVGNTGTKVIAAIDWEYYSGGGGAVDKIASLAKFRGEDLKLHSGDRKKLTQTVHRYSDQFVTGFNLSTVRIVRVEYEDGEPWKRE